MRMKHYYVPAANERGFTEVTQAEWNALLGDETTHPYAGKVYRGEMSIDDVPVDVRDSVQSVVDARIARWGAYNAQDIPAHELKSMIEEAV